MIAQNFRVSSNNFSWFPNDIKIRNRFFSKSLLCRGLELEILRGTSFKPVELSKKWLERTVSSETTTATKITLSLCIVYMGKLLVPLFYYVYCQFLNNFFLHEETANVFWMSGSVYSNEISPEVVTHTYQPEREMREAIESNKSVTDAMILIFKMKLLFSRVETFFIVRWKFYCAMGAWFYSYQFFTNIITINISFYTWLIVFGPSFFSSGSINPGIHTCKTIVPLL